MNVVNAMNIESLDDIKNFMEKTRRSDEQIAKMLEPFFIETCELDINGKISNKKLYEAYENWSQRKYILDTRSFNKHVRKLGVKAIRKLDGYYWIGLKLKYPIKISDPQPKKERTEQHIYSLDEAIEGLEDTHQNNFV